MNTSTIFEDFLSNLSIKNSSEISDRYKRITKAINKVFWNSESETRNSYQIGSYGRRTAVQGISDLDMLFELPNDVFARYNSRAVNGQSALLQDVKAAIKNTYPATDIRGDGQVVVVTFSNHVIEVCPGFLLLDGRYKYPDSNDGGIWRYTDPIPEIEEISRYNNDTNGNLKKLAKMCRAWKNKCGVKIGGLLIDTLCYEFFKTHTKHYSTTYSSYDILVRDFFEYLKDYDTDRKYWIAPGSNQRVYKKKSNFISKAKKAYNNVVEAIDKKENATVYSIWKKVFGYPFPYPKVALESSENYTSDEEFIENKYPVDITNSLRIDCSVSQDGYRSQLLSKLLETLKIHKKLRFFIDSTDVEGNFDVIWKVKNEGAIAKARNNFRGQLLDDTGSHSRVENSNFAGPHFVECYVIKNGICIARDRIDVPISNI